MQQLQTDSTAAAPTSGFITTIKYLQVNEKHRDSVQSTLWPPTVWFISSAGTQTQKFRNGDGLLLPPSSTPHVIQKSTQHQVSSSEQHHVEAGSPGSLRTSAVTTPGAVCSLHVKSLYFHDGLRGVLTAVVKLRQEVKPGTLLSASECEMFRPPHDLMLACLNTQIMIISVIITFLFSCERKQNSKYKNRNK